MTGLSLRRATSTGGCGLMVGVMPIKRRLEAAMFLKMGAAIAPPVSPPLRGESIMTMTVMIGLRDGTKPTNDTFCCDGE